MVPLIAVLLKLGFSAPGIWVCCQKRDFVDMSLLRGCSKGIVMRGSKERFWHAEKALPSSAAVKGRCGLCVSEEEGILTRNPNSTFRRYSPWHVRLPRQRTGHCSWKPVLADGLDSLSNQRQKYSPANRQHSIQLCLCGRGSEGDPPGVDCEQKIENDARILIQRIDCREQEGAIAIRAQCMCRGTIDRRMLDTSVVLVVVRAIVRVAPRLSEWKEGRWTCL